MGCTHIQEGRGQARVIVEVWRREWLHFLFGAWGAGLTLSHSLKHAPDF